ncbi:hypothetical protein DMA11_01825 [Marinilabiliaceae bacterium JC017]|nr:hypothetical protein DMA11_01825 [Marinilabiliaceae bacterium JC017]
MIANYYFLAFLPFLISCSNVQANSQQKIRNKLSVTEATEKDSLSKKIVYDFYTWYVYNEYPKRRSYYRNAPFKKFNDNTYGLDIEVFKERLEEISFFSESFKDMLIQENIECHKKILEVDWGGINPELEADFNISNCFYRWSNDWFGGQEDGVYDFKLLPQLKKEGEKYIYTVQSLINGIKFNQYKIVVIKENEEYKIDLIERL